MKLAVFCIGGLNKAMMSRLRLEVLDSIPHRDIESTIPSNPLTSWSSAWSGVGPACHGKVAGIKGRKKNLNTIWDDLEKNHEVVVYDEGEWLYEADKDIGVYRLDSMSDSVINGDLAQAQETLNSAMPMIDKVIKMDILYLIVSAFGTAKYTTSLNVDKMLIAKNLIMMSDRGMEYSETLAYPANYTGKKPRFTHGIMLNSTKRVRGFMEDRHVMDIQGNLMMQLNTVEGIQAKPAHLQYDISGDYYGDMPDIVLDSPNNLTCFRCVGDIDADVLSPYYEYGLSSRGLVASNEQSLIRDTNTVLDIGKAISKGIKL